MNKLNHKATKFFEKEHDEIISEKICDKCWLCEKEFDNQAQIMHFCKLSGKYLGNAHNQCIHIAEKNNRNHIVPIFFHNLEGYDSHIFINKLINSKKDEKIHIIPHTNEKFMSFNYGKLKFLDSLKFLQHSLDECAQSLKDKDFIFLKKEFGDNYHLFTKKIAYSYDYFETLEDYEKDINLLKDDDYYSRLNCSIPDKIEIDRTKEIIKIFNIRNGRELTQLYCKADVLLLSDIMEDFINNSKNEFGIDPQYHISAPSLTWSAGLKNTNVSLERIQDIDMFKFFENAIRGGISSVLGKRYVRSTKKVKVLYKDMNNLYGWAMSQYLPIDNFKNENIDIIDKVLNTRDDNNIGYFVMVDLKYPKEIKRHTKDYPLCPEIKIPNENEFSNYMNNNKPDKYKPVKKMILDQNDKYNYITHYRNLKFYIRMGMVITKVHKIVSFRQSLWLKEYIDFNTKRRAISESEAKKEFHKLMINSFFGKTMENLLKRLSIKLLKNTDEVEILKKQTKLNFNGILTHYDGYCSYGFKTNALEMSKPIYLGATILELSKLLMYETFYDKLKIYYNNKIKLHYTDCDSFVMSIKTNNIVNDLKELQELYQLYDFHNLNKNHILYNTDLKKIPGYLKIETPKSIWIKEFASIKSKAYSFTTNNDKNKNLLKGIKKCVKNNQLNINDYKNCLFGKDFKKQVTQNILKASKHDIYLESVTKKTMDLLDDKRYYINSLESVPFGYYKII